jgi:hypothetical protein
MRDDTEDPEAGQPDFSALPDVDREMFEYIVQLRSLYLKAIRPRALAQALLLTPDSGDRPGLFSPLPTRERTIGTEHQRQLPRARDIINAPLSLAAILPEKALDGNGAGMAHSRRGGQFEMPMEVAERTPPHPAVRGAAADMIARFEELWALYPRKIARERCLKAFLALKPSSTTFARMLEALKRQRVSAQWIQGVIPNPLTWLHQRRWEDQIEHVDPLQGLREWRKESER